MIFGQNGGNYPNQQREKDAGNYSNGEEEEGEG